MMSARRVFDEHMMQIAVAMARRGLGNTAPNPAVGAVIADEETGELIARGWTQPGGRPHAEKEALARGGSGARGKTMYVTLEPCAHTGRVPTCADSIVTSGLKRVVCAIPDPNPVVSGRGFAQLRAAGIEVDVGLLADDARWVTLGHIRRITERRPFVLQKMALDARGAVAAGNGAPVWVTGEQARAFAHLIRAETDAILVGSGTVLIDDPELTCRLPGLAQRSPDRIVIDSGLRTSPRAKIYRHQGERPRLWLATAPGASAGEAWSAEGVGIIEVPRARTGGVDLVQLLHALAERGVTRLMVEGGPTIWRAFLEARLVDECCCVFGPEVADGPVIPVIEGPPDPFFSAYGLAPHGTGWLGPDRLHVYRRINP